VNASQEFARPWGRVDDSIGREKSSWKWTEWALVESGRLRDSFFALKVTLQFDINVAVAERFLTRGVTDAVRASSMPPCLQSCGSGPFGTPRSGRSGRGRAFRVLPRIPSLTFFGAPQAHLGDQAAEVWYRPRERRRTKRGTRTDFLIPVKRGIPMSREDAGSRRQRGPHEPRADLCACIFAFPAR